MSATTLSKPNSAASSEKLSITIQVWRAIVGALSLTTGVMLAVYFIVALNYLNTPFVGAFFTQDGRVNPARPLESADWPLLAAGLQVGDRIVAIGGASVVDGGSTATLARINEQLASLNPQQRVTVEYMPVGAASGDRCENGICSVTITPTALSGTDFLSYFGLPFFTAMILFGLGVLVLRYRHDQTEGIIATATAMVCALFAAGIFDVGTTGLLTPVWLLSTLWISGTMLTLASVFPRRLRFMRSIPMLEYAPIIITTLIGGFFVFGYLNPDAFNTIIAWPQNATTISALSLFVTIWLVMTQQQRASNPISRDQSNTIFIGFALMVLPAGLWFLSRMLASDIFIINFESMIPLYIFPNAAIAYAVLQYRRFDTDRVISYSITYVIMIGALIVAIFLLVLGSSMLALNVMNSTAEIIPVSAVLFVMVLAFTPVRNRLQERIDKIYYRKQHNLQQEIESFSNRITTLGDYNAIVETFLKTLGDTVTPTSVFIFLKNRISGDYVTYAEAGNQTDVRFMKDSVLVQALLNENAQSKTISLQPGEPWPYSLLSEQPRLQLLKARIIIGMTGSDNLNGFVIFGAPRSGNVTFNYSEVHFMESLVGQFAIATERSQVIASLERRVHELDVLSQVGQAVNFTIEFDDLLELIYAQTSRLVEAPNFYIALFEERLEKLYFAFFLENDERIEDRENDRWAPGLDMFSYIIKHSTAVRLDDYAKDVRANNFDPSRISGNLKTWIGVPLTAGRRTLGVMAAGKIKDSTPYTDDTFKIFTDIASLAATSLDKANLFNQTKIRERQLTVLNDISRQLVATESDVEKLLQIIVNSAVEILNTEAGSLLLKTEDDSGDLEFRVVAGGGGDELIGKRIEAGTGVVGEVVTTSKPIISNDAENDARHKKEVTKDFVSHSLLAVPLIAKNDVIGVLEVINKKDGTIFFEEDADLLSTFSGQAAVAIENARLFQLTDQQLAQRVRELEVLERLDAELNRTRDLKEVSDITVRTAMNVLKADSGILGVVHLMNEKLEVITIEGYHEGEYPDGADGMMWPLNKGIIARVMRNRQPDIVMDVTMDPDYKHGLTGSNSQITIPMIGGDTINAILILEKNSLPRFSLPEWAFAQRIAEHASIAIENAQFFAALELANKGKSEFMGFAAHELKNPLASVKGYADVLISGMTGELSEQQSNFLSVIKTNADRMERLISDLRDFAKFDAGEFTVETEPINIRHAVIETLRPFSRKLQEDNQELVNDVPDDLPLVMGDEGRLIQVFTNFISNANKYSDSGTTITVTGRHEPNFVNKKGEKRGEMVVISVIDQGFGMSEEDQEKLFKERYFRSTNQEALQKEGTGLGMVLTQQIIVQHEGEIWVESKMGEGSTFSIAIPVAKDEYTTQTQSRRPNPAPASD